MGCPFDPAQGKGSPLYVNPVTMLKIVTKILADGKGIFARGCLKLVRLRQGSPSAKL
jgi:hypothetical protein